MPQQQKNQNLTFLLIGSVSDECNNGYLKAEHDPYKHSNMEAWHVDPYLRTSNDKVGVLQKCDESHKDEVNDDRFRESIPNSV